MYLCHGCLNEVDPETCQCGSGIGQCDNHSFVPMGCDCHNLSTDQLMYNRKLIASMQLLKDIEKCLTEISYEHRGDALRVKALCERIERTIDDRLLCKLL
jgi:hypothetical protein